MQAAGRFLDSRDVLLAGGGVRPATGAGRRTRRPFCLLGRRVLRLALPLQLLLLLLLLLAPFLAEHVAAGLGVGMMPWVK